MRYVLEETGGWVILRLSGRARKEENLLFRRGLRPILGRAGLRVVLDLREVTEVGSYEMGVLNAIRKQVVLRGGFVRLAGLSAAARSRLGGTPLKRLVEGAPNAPAPPTREGDSA